MKQTPRSLQRRKDGEEGKGNKDSKGSKEGKTMKEIQDRFINAFAKVLLNGDRPLIEEYTETLCDITARAWELRWQGEKSPYPLERLERNCKILLNAAADSEKKVSKQLFVKLLSKIYHRLKDRINEDRLLQNYYPKERKRQPTQSFNILDDWSVYTFLSKILSEVDIRTLKEVSISQMLYNMQVTDFALFIEGMRDNENYSMWGPNFSITYIIRNIGWYLNKQMETNDINDIFMVLPFAKNCVMSRNNIKFPVTIGNAEKKVIERAFAIEKAIYICGLINTGLIDVAENVLLPYLDKNSQYSYHYYERYYYYERYNECDCRNTSNCCNCKDENCTSDNVNLQFVFPIAVFCYLYYLGFWEEEKYVKPKLRQEAKKLAYKLSTHYKELLSITEALKFMVYELGDETTTGCGYIYPIMEKYFDQRAGSETSYEIVIGDMVKDFCLFSILFAGARSYNPHNGFGAYGLDWVCDNKHYYYKEKYLNYIRNEAETLRKLNDFLEFIDEANRCEVTYNHTNGNDMKPKNYSECPKSQGESAKYTAKQLFENLKTIKLD